MTRSLTSHDDWCEALLLDEDAWDVPRRLTDTDLFTHGIDGWRRAGCGLDDPEDRR